MPHLLLDCDPGHDDAIALLLAAGNPDVSLAAVTTVAGNQTLEKVTRNALAVGTVAGLTDVPFAAGAPRPLVRAAVIAPEYHGESGLDGPTLPEPAIELDGRHAVQVIIDTVMAEPPGTVTLVPTGALTNIALAARLEPRIIDRVARVVLMGGAVSGGNLTPAAEYNIAIDPEAAAIVFDAGWEVVMLGLDVTHQALATAAVVEAIGAVGTTSSRFVLDLLEFFTTTYREQGFAAPPVHDVCAVAYAIDPSIFHAVRAPIAVELHGGLTTGMTVVDRRRPADDACTTIAVLGLDADRFWALVVEALRRLP